MTFLQFLSNNWLAVGSQFLAVIVAIIGGYRLGRAKSEEVARLEYQRGRKDGRDSALIEAANAGLGIFSFRAVRQLLHRN